MCVIIGIFIDNRFGTSTLIWLLFLGIAAGMRNAYILIKGVLKENDKEREKAEKEKEKAEKEKKKSTPPKQAKKKKENYVRY